MFTLATDMILYAKHISLCDPQFKTKFGYPCFTGSEKPDNTVRFYGNIYIESTAAGAVCFDPNCGALSPLGLFLSRLING